MLNIRGMVQSGDGRVSRRCRIALADDSERLRGMVRRMLDGLGEFEVVGEASTGREAVGLVERTAPDLLLLDLSMPDMDGLEVLAELARRGSPAAVMVYSAFTARSPIASRARALGAVDVVEKDVTPIEFQARLRAAWNSAWSR